MSSESQLVAVNITSDIFHGDLLSSLLFVLALIPVTFLLQKIKQYVWERELSKITYFLWTKLHGYNGIEIDSLVQTKKIVSEDIE